MTRRSPQRATQTTCDRCGVEIQQNPRGRIRLTCSTACRSALWEQKAREQGERTPREPRVTADPLTYIQKRTVVLDGCWIWQQALGRGGYARITLADRSRHMAHRWAYEQLVGPVPAGLQLDHLCRKRACVNPEHLEPVTAQENNARGISPSARNLGKVACVNGHPFTPENTLLAPDGRRCRTCRNDRQRAYTARKRAER